MKRIKKMTLRTKLRRQKINLKRRKKRRLRKMKKRKIRKTKLTRMLKTSIKKKLTGIGSKHLISTTL